MDDTITNLNTDKIELTDISVTSASASGNGTLSYNNTTGVLTFTPASVPTDTDGLSEGASNLYFTNARADGRISAASINALSDVDTSGVTDGKILKWNASSGAWIVATETGGVALTDLSVGAEATASGDGAISYNNSTGVFTYTPADTSTFITASSTETLTNKSGNVSMFTNDSGYATAASSTAFTNKTGNISQWTNDSAYLTAITAQSINSLTDVDTTGVADGKILKYNASTSDWIVATDSGGIALTDLSVGAEATASGDGGIAYNNSTGVFTYTPPDTSTFVTASSSTAFTNKTGNISQWTNDSAYLTTITAQSINSLTDVDTTGVADGKILKYNASTSDWIVADDTDTGISNVVEDTTPQAGGNFDLNGHYLFNSGVDSAGVGEPIVLNDMTRLGNVLDTNGNEIRNNSGGNIILNPIGGNIDLRGPIVNQEGSDNVLINEQVNISGTAGGLTDPILKLETDNSGWNRPLMMLVDSNGDATLVTTSLPLPKTIQIKVRFLWI